MDEQKKYEVIKLLADHPNPNKERAAITLGCTVRHINRMLKGYKEHGKEFFMVTGDVNRSVPSLTKLDPLSLICIVQSTMMLTLNILPSFWPNMRESTSLPLPYLTFSKMSISFLLKLPKPSANASKGNWRTRRKQPGPRRKPMQSRPILLLLKMRTPDAQELLTLESFSKWMLPHINGFPVRYGTCIWLSMMLRVVLPEAGLIHRKP